MRLPQFANYTVSNDGVIIGPNGVELKPFEIDSGYLRVGIAGKNYFVHRIVAAAFLGLDLLDSKIQVHHKDFNKSNNSVNNLELCRAHQNNEIHRANKYADSSGFKECRTCRKILASCNFSIRGSSRDGLDFSCRSCKKSQSDTRKLTRSVL